MNAVALSTSERLPKYARLPVQQRVSLIGSDAQPSTRYAPQMRTAPVPSCPYRSNTHHFPYFYDVHTFLVLKREVDFVC
jgi:hypothetical protein